MITVQTLRIKSSSMAAKTCIEHFLTGSRICVKGRKNHIEIILKFRIQVQSCI